MNQNSTAARAVVVHVADAEQDIDRAIRTSQALQERFPALRVRIIVNGPALTAVRSVTPGELPQNVGVAVCALGLQRHGIAESEVPDGVEIVPTAPVAIMEEQFNGAAYLRL